VALLVTGSTGRLGGRIAGRLAASGVEQRLLVREPWRAPRLTGAITMRGGYTDADAVRAAAESIATVLMVSATESADRVDVHTAFIDAVVAAGVRHIVYISFYNAAPDATFSFARDHWHTEQHIRETGVDFTFLRDNMYLDFLPLMLGRDGVIRGPAGEGRVTAVAQDDIADVAAAVLRQPHAHKGATYDLTGGEALSLHDLAAHLSRTTGRPVRYEPETIEEAYASRAGHGAAEWEVTGWVTTYVAIAQGELDGVSEAVERITGHPPLTLQQLPAG
jgi:NAD(P)H dehydrogenase (quinone)